MVCNPHYILLGDKIDMNEVGGACSTYRGGQRSIQVLVGKPEVKSSIRRPRRRWEGNIKMDLEEVGRGVVEWIDLGQVRDRWRALVIAVMMFGFHKMRRIS